MYEVSGWNILLGLHLVISAGIFAWRVSCIPDVVDAGIVLPEKFSFRLLLFILLVVTSLLWPIFIIDMLSNASRRK
jgi:hypothetical protein